jgi:O-antigen ligase
VLAHLPPDLRFVGIYGAEGQTASSVSNGLAIAFALMVTYGIARLTLAKSLWAKAFYAGWNLVMAIFIFLTFSRRGYITLILGPILLLWWWKKRELGQIQSLLLGVIVFVVAIGVLWTTPLGELVVGRLTDRLVDNKSLDARQDDWQFIWGELMQSPTGFLWGYGMASTGPASVRFNVPNAKHAHNYYLMLWHQMGIMGLGIFLWLLWHAVKFGRRVVRKVQNTDLEPEALFSVIIVIMLAINGLLGTTFEAYPNDLYFWTAIGSLIAINSISKQLPAYQPGQ